MARTPLTRERIVDAAMDLADEVGLEALSMRKLGDRLGVEAMSLYNHVANKDDLLDGMADAFMASIDIPSPGDEWKEAMRLRANSAREQFARHRWALSLVESRPNAGFETIRYHDAIIGVLREAGFSIEMTAHAFALAQRSLVVKRLVALTFRSRQSGNCRCLTNLALASATQTRISSPCLTTTCRVGTTTSRRSTSACRLTTRTCRTRFRTRPATPSMPGQAALSRQARR